MSDLNFSELLKMGQGGLNQKTGGMVDPMGMFDPMNITGKVGSGLDMGLVGMLMGMLGDGQKDKNKQSQPDYGLNYGGISPTSQQGSSNSAKGNIF